MSSDEAEPVQDLEHISFRVDYDLIPEWSSVLERIATVHGVQSALGVDGTAMVVRIALAPDKKPKLMADVQRYWDQFVERRKREGRWKR